MSHKTISEYGCGLLLPNCALQPNRLGLDVYVPGPLTHRPQLFPGAAPLPKLAIAVKGFWGQHRLLLEGFPSPQTYRQDAYFQDRT